MLSQLRRRWNQSRLKDSRWQCLFEPIEDEWVSLDCETTSLNVKEAEILSIGAVKIQGSRILTSESFYRIVRPEVAPTAESIGIHGLRPIDVMKGIPLEQALFELLEFIGGRGLVGYYLEYDVAMINKFLKPLIGCRLPQRQVEVSGLYYDWCLRRHPDSYVDLRLQSILDELNIPTLARHDALNDAVTAAMIYQVMLARKHRRH